MSVPLYQRNFVLPRGFAGRRSTRQWCQAFRSLSLPGSGEGSFLVPGIHHTGITAHQRVQLKQSESNPEASERGIDSRIKIQDSTQYQHSTLLTIACSVIRSREAIGIITNNNAMIVACEIYDNIISQTTSIIPVPTSKIQLKAQKLSSDYMQRHQKPMQPH